MSKYNIELIKIKKSYSGNTVLSDLSLNIENNTVISIIGPDGSGKTTLLKIILGIIDYDGGEIIKLPYDNFGFMLDDYKPYGRLTLLQNMVAFSKLSKNKIP
ncbi:MAG: ATP-binding cassette domain-containing protein, partial [Candidatus Delongbacteria bacterium]|nr:ATP-binding cassette domain-containing protein [Candidatus Delongbacteria bacterium]MCG2761120.1 ATP-binding cassette domain-containing protein [Candidatus Delongbacteria bacterium]